MGFRVTIKETNRTILTEHELGILSSKILPVKRLDQIRDAFLFSCYTGLFFSDVEKLTNDDIIVGVDGEKWISINRMKTNTASRIPLLPIPISIIDKYNHDPALGSGNKLLPIPSNQRMNSYLKEVACACGFNKELTFHCARHTFATTVTLTNGVSIESVSKMLGHENLRTTQHYAKVIEIYSRGRRGVDPGFDRNIV